VTSRSQSPVPGDLVPGAGLEAAPAHPLLEVQELSVEFPTAHGVVLAGDAVSFSLDQGETLGVVGESGSGKSVLLRAVMGLFPADVARRSGSVRFAGRELVGAPRSELRKLWGREISIVFQDPMTSLNPVMRVGKQVAESVRGGDAKEKTVELLRLVGIPEPERRLRQYPHELSGGMRQRVAIAIALAARPRLLLADEPTTALDVTVQAQILDLLGTLQRELRMALVLVTHDLGVVAARTDRIMVMYAGQVVEHAPTREIFTTTRMPYTEALVRSIPRLDYPPHSRLYTIPGRPPDLSRRMVGCRFSARCPYVQPRCREEVPPLDPLGTADHLVRCWYPVGTPAGAEALARNRAEGLLAARFGGGGS
jgi:oligopeptide/dipeptide ABC transporter ATP-binding protein